MNKLIDNFFEKDLVLKILSVLIAILIWFVVMDKDNPFEERTLSVPLTSNAEVLQTNNLQIVGTQIPTSIDIKIKGRRQKIMGVTSNDFQAAIDLSDVTESGSETITVSPPKYLGDKDILISAMSPASLDLRFERIIGKQYPVNVEYTGKLPSGYELVNLKVEPNNVILEEKESSISKIDKVVAMINLDEIKNNKEIVMKGTVLDNNGQPLRQFEGKVPLIITFDIAKKVPVVAATKGQPLVDWYLKEVKYSLPAIRVIGAKGTLDGLLNIGSEPVDISEKSGSFKTSLSLILPKGLTVLKEDTEQLTAEVILERYQSRSITIPSNMISIYESDPSGVNAYRVSDENVTITVKGRVEAFNSVLNSSIKLSVNVSGLNQGEHAVPLVVILPNGLSLVGEYSVKVSITESVPVDHNTPETIEENIP